MTRRRHSEGVHKQQRPPRRMAVNHGRLADFSTYLRAEPVLAGLPAGAAELTTRFTRLGFVDREGTAIELLAVESLDSRFGCLALGHFDKPEAFGAPGVT